MDHSRIQKYMDFHQFKRIARKSHKGADIFIAEKYSNHDPEFPEPHIQTWLHIGMGEDTPMVGQKLFFRFGRDLPDQKSRIAKAVEQAEVFIEHIGPGFDNDRTASRN